MARQLLYQLEHCAYQCSYHIVWTCKYRNDSLVDNFIKAELKRIFKQIAKWKNFKIHAWHIGNDHIHLYLTTPPKYSISYAIQILKGKSSSWIKKKTKRFPKGVLWTRGYFVSTIGINEHQIANYINNKRHHQVDLTQLKLI